MTVKTAIGFSMRANKCITGDFACEKAIKAGKARIAMLDGSASDATKQRYMALCGRNGIMCIIIEGMGEAIGKEGRMVAVVTDVKFAGMICEAYKEGNNHGGIG